MLLLQSVQEPIQAPRCSTPRSLKPPKQVVDVTSTTIDLPADSKFGAMIRKLQDLLGTSHGLSLEDIDVEQVKEIMESYESDERDWEHLALHDPSRNYLRNGIININNNANLLILVWSPGKLSAIHDHANAHCCMKILKGELVESLYDIPDPSQPTEMVARQHTSMERDTVGYILDKIGLHKVSNPLTDYSVSLHLYTPPYALMYGCSMYETNGTKHHVEMSRYYSWQGQLVNASNHSTC